MREPSSLVARLVAVCSSRAWLTLLVTAALCGLAVYYTMSHFVITTDTEQLISPDLPWRRDMARLEATFPQRNNVIVAVVDGATPELAARASDDLAASLAKRSSIFQLVQQPDGGPFFEKNGLMFLSVDEVRQNTSQLINAQPFLGPLTADPSLRGIMDSLSTVLLGVKHGDTKLDSIDSAMRSLAQTLDRIDAGEPAFFSWRDTISGKPAGTRETRHIVLAQPKLNYGQFFPTQEAVDTIEAAVRELKLDPAHGVTVRLTGQAIMADQEFATVAEHAGLIAITMSSALLLMLWLAVRSIRITLSIMATALMGLALTAGIGLFLVGRYNLISVAFVPLFVGLGVDFAIQFSVRYRAERVERSLHSALIAAGNGVGGSLALATAAIGLGFFAFLPTPYLGASELGLMSGIGMVIAFLLSVTLLPALLALLHPRPEAKQVGFASLSSLNRQLLLRRRPILIASGLIAAVCLGLLPFLQFDFNPLHLRSRKMEAVSTFLSLLSDPDRTPNVVDVLTPSLAEADALAQKLAGLPEVRHAVTLNSFIPDHQKEKLQIIQDAADLLGLTFNPPSIKPPPTDAEVVQSLKTTAAALAETAGSETSEAAGDARRFAAALDRLASGTPALRERASQTLIVSLRILIDQVGLLLQAQPITLQSLPPNLVRDWVAADGQAKVEVVPNGNSNDNRTLARFVDAVRTLAPHATGAPVAIQEAARMIVGSFVEAGILSFVAISALLAFVLRRARDVVLTMIPILLTGLLTLASCVVINQSLNFANIIALPLLFGLGVAFNIYFVRAWRAGEGNLLKSSLTRAVLFSALATGTAFGSLLLSAHPGTASMGRLLMISLAWTLVTTLLFEPALLGRPANRGASAKTKSDS